MTSIVQELAEPLEVVSFAEGIKIFAVERGLRPDHLGLDSIAKNSHSPSEGLLSLFSAAVGVVGRTCSGDQNCGCLNVGVWILGHQRGKLLARGHRLRHAACADQGLAQQHLIIEQASLTIIRMMPGLQRLDESNAGLFRLENRLARL